MKELDRWDCNECPFSWYVKAKTSVKEKNCPNCSSSSIDIIFNVGKAEI